LSDIAPFETEKSVLGTPSTKGTLTGLDVADFVDEVSRDSPAPGGGSIAALAGSLAAALSSMVANLTFAKRKFRKRRPQMEALSIEAQAVKDELLRAVDQDTAAFEAVIDAMRLPHGTAEQKEFRDRAIEAGYRHATEVPLTTARLCQQVMALALRATEQGLPSGITDAGTACWMARAGLEGAILNVRINLLEITDQQWRNSVSEKITLIQDDARSTLDLCQKRLEEILGS
jgi:glutamate formiminotransferase/formiminotetrahydrofolate cyclodeaminase